MGTIDVSVSCAQRSLKPGEEPEDEQREPPVVGALSRVDRQMQQSTGEGERDHHRERTADQRTQPAEEARVPADVGCELELAAVDALHDAHDRADGACDQRRDRRRPREGQVDRREDREHGGDHRHAGEVRHLRLAVRGLVVVRLGLVDRRALLGDGGG